MLLNVFIIRIILSVNFSTCTIHFSTLEKVKVHKLVKEEDRKTRRA